MNRKDAEPHMWDYWRGKYGVVEALKEYYPQTLAANPGLQLAVYQYECAIACINRTMKKLQQEEDDT